MLGWEGDIVRTDLQQEQNILFWEWMPSGPSIQTEVKLVLGFKTFKHRTIVLSGIALQNTY